MDKNRKNDNYIMYKIGVTIKRINLKMGKNIRVNKLIVLENRVLIGERL